MRKKKAPKEKKIPKARKPKAIKTRNNGKWSDSQFFGWLRSKLRRASIMWSPINQVRQEAKIPYVGPNKRRKFSYICSECKLPKSGDEISVHHKIECGSLKTFDDLGPFAERLFCEKDGLCVLCNDCHAKLHSLNC